MFPGQKQRGGYLSYQPVIALRLFGRSERNLNPSPSLNTHPFRGIDAIDRECVSLTTLLGELLRREGLPDCAHILSETHQEPVL